MPFRNGLKEAVQKQKNCPKIVMPAEAGIQEKQSLMDSRLPSGVGHGRGNDAERRFLDGPVSRAFTQIPSPTATSENSASWSCLRCDC